MKKQYIKIEATRDGEQKNVSVFLLTDNITGFLHEADQTRLYFKNSNPFSYARLYMSAETFERLMKKQLFIHQSPVDGTTFIYTVIEL